MRNRVLRPLTRNQKVYGAAAGMALMVAFFLAAVLVAVAERPTTDPDMIRVTVKIQGIIDEGKYATLQGYIVYTPHLAETETVADVWCRTRTHLCWSSPEFYQTAQTLELKWNWAWILLVGTFACWLAFIFGWPKKPTVRDEKPQE